MHSQSTSGLDSLVEKEPQEKVLKKSSSVKDFFRIRKFLGGVKVAAANEKMMSSHPDEKVYHEVAESTVKEVVDQATHSVLFETNEEYQNEYMSGKYGLKGSLSIRELSATKLDITPRSAEKGGK